MLKPVSLVLSSGGARGIAHIGVIEVLEKYGFTIQSVAGASMGAMVGGMYASGNLSVFKDWLCSLTLKEMIRLIDLSISTEGFIKGNKVITEIEKLIPDRDIESLRIPFVAVSTDVVNNREIVHDKGSLFHAIRGSISIPFVFKPFPSDGTFLIDGGILNPLPIDCIKRHENDILVTVNVGAYKTLHHVEKSNTGTSGKTVTKAEDHGSVQDNHVVKANHVNLAYKSIALMINRIAEMTVEKYKPDIVIDIEHDSFSVYEFYKAPEIIELGRIAAEEKIREYLQKQP
jgi:NTE family protein